MSRIIVQTTSTTLATLATKWPILLFTIIGLILLNGCASEKPESSVCAYSTPTDPLSLQAPEQLTNSYIAVFKAPSLPHTFQMTSFRHEQRYAQFSIADSIERIPDLAQSQFIAAIDLNMETAFDQKFDLFSPVWQRRMQQINHRTQTGMIVRLDFKKGSDPTTILEDLTERQHLWYWEPNYVSRTQEHLLTPENQGTGSQSFEDHAAMLDEITSYWWLSAIHLADAYREIHDKLGGKPDNLTNPTHRPIVAVLDSGVDYLHPALAGKIWVNESGLNTANCKNDTHGCNTTVAEKGSLGNGDVFPYGTTAAGQACPNDADPNCEHGTHVAGIIAADLNWTDEFSKLKVTGICPVCRIMPMKIVSKVGDRSGILDSSIIAALKYISYFNSEQDRVRLINASFGKFVRSRSVSYLVSYLRQERGTLVIAAAGNEDSLSMEYPAAFDDSLGVAAVNSDLKKVPFSNFGTWVDLSAPGSEIVSTVPGTGVANKSGTSMATPFVSGVAGLILATNPDISFSELKSRLLDTADPTFYEDTWADGFNHDCYYLEVPGEKVKQPLLGRGVLSAIHAVSAHYVPDLPIYSATERVKPGCGQISRVQSPAATPAGGLLLLLVPVVVMLIRKIIL